MKIGIRRLRFFILFCIVCSPGLMIPQLIINDESSIQDVPLMTETVMKNTASMSMPFIKNEGQADPQVKFYADTFAGTVYLTENDLTYVIPTEDGSFVIKEAPHGGDLAPSADTPSETTVNYFKGTEENWHTDVPTYDSVSAGFGLIALYLDRLEKLIAFAGMAALMVVILFVLARTDPGDCLE